LLRFRLLHDQVHEVLVAAECIAIAHKRKQLGSVLDFDSSWQHVPVAVLSLPGDKKIAGDLVGFDPDVDGSHHLPFVDWAHFLVKGAEVPCCLDTFRRDVPESTSIWKT
jgi:hypothetical protein